MSIKVLNALHLGSNKITNLANGTASGDAVNYSQLQAAVNGLGWREKVRVVAVANVTISNGLENGDTIDGVTLATGDRVLLTAQSTASQNGIYIVAASGAASRATDLAAAASAANAAVFVGEGTTYADTQWKCTDNVGSDVVGTNDLTFVQFGGGLSYTAGDALTLTGSDFDVNVDNSTIEINSDALRVKDAGITNAKLAATAKSYAADIGDGSTTAIAVTHNLGTRDVIVQVYDAATYETVLCEVVRTSTSVVTLTFAVAPASNAYRVVIRP